MRTHQQVGNTTYSNNTFPLLYWTGPSETGPMLIWQQPHIIWMTELQRLHADTPAEAKVGQYDLTGVIDSTCLSFLIGPHTRRFSSSNQCCLVDRGRPHVGGGGSHC